MDAAAWRVQLAPGEGLVFRAGPALLLALPKGEEQDAFVDALRDSISTVVQADSSAPGRRVARTVAGSVAQSDDAGVPALAVAAATEDGLALLLVGDVEVEITGADGAVELLSGRDASTWVDKVVRGEFSSVTARVGPSAEIDARSDFGGGAVRGSGFRLLSGAGVEVPTRVAELVPEEVAPAEQPPEQAATSVPAAPEPLPETSAHYTVGLLATPLSDEELAPLPILEEPAAAVDGVEVQGIVCSRGHFNDPTSIYCATCGISMVHQTHNLVPGQRPPLGVVVLDDGAVFPLTEDYVLGREPLNSEDVQAGRAVPLQLDDPDAMVSRVHAKILLQGWDVRIVDAHSANGTFVTKPGDSESVRLAADEPMTIVPGTRIAMGTRSLVFDSYRKH